jgi:hypothetical protein
LYGLPDFNVEFIKENLNHEKLFPVEVKKLKINNTKYDYQCHYLLYFKKSDKIKISQVREIKYLCRCVVRWEYYAHRRIGPTQCSNCQGFRHGTQHCHLKPKCIRCSLSHKSSECPLLDTNNPKSKTPVENLKCANCGGNHVASYSKCPERIVLIKARETANNRLKNRRSNFSFTPAPELNNFNFPGITKQPSTSNAWSSRTLDPRSRIINNQPNKSDDLLTPEECYSVFNEFLDALSQCQTRIDQMRVIAQITLKYLPK